jgi:hypothetical protein
MARVLMVLDGEYRFTGADATGTRDFTYTTLVNALETAGHQVTKAHRQSDTSGGVLQTFNFDTSVNLLDFDVLWLIGHNGRNAVDSTGTSAPSIDDTQIRAIARFMAAGGGVFATGDHDSIGSVMCGRIPRVRSMRCWFGVNDSASPMPAGFPRNFPVITSLRADTTQRSSGSNYGGDTTFVWFENQSDSTPQPITPSASPAHPILRRGGSDIVIYPDHMHEGQTLGEVMGYNYTQSLPFAGESFTEYPVVAAHREMPKIIATGKTTAFASRTVTGGGFVGNNSEASGLKNVNTLSVYDGRVAGVGRIVTGSTFHHYIDINLTGDSSVDTPADITSAGTDAQKNHGFNDAAAPVFDTIKTVYVNIVNWLARPRPRIQLILERSTFSQAEALASSDFDGAILVTIDGLKPSQFPGGGITSLAAASFQAAWAPTITPLDPTGLSIIPIDVDSDDPTLPDRLQRITFTYRVQVTAASAFGFPGDFKHVQVNASLSSPAVSGPLTDSAQITLVKNANPFMLDLASGNTVPWLSTDLRVFPVVAGAPGSGLVNNATRAQALAFLRNRVNTMTVADFEALPTGHQASALSPLPTTTGFPPRRVYNFAVARVRLPASGSSANGVRVFFRIFVSQTTAALTYNESPPGTPIEGYKKFGTPPIAVPGTNSAGTQWLSFPMFSAERMFPPETQVDVDNLKDGLVAGSSKFFGALIDNNLGDAYLPATPISGGAAQSLPTLMMGEHQCIVAQIEFPSTPIPNGATPFTSDKLSQRNLALSAVANPGLDASRMALHTFEIEATPLAIGGGILPDELLLQWHGEPPDGVEVHLEISTWNAREVVDLAERFYPRHEIRALDSNTVAVPGGGVRYVPIPRSDIRQTGVITVHFPLGVKEDQRFDISVRQVTTRGRQLEIEQPKVTTISREDAAQLLTPEVSVTAAAPLPKGAFNLGKNRVLITDLRLLDAAGDHALIIEHPDPEEVARAAAAGRWRETIGAFQLGIPVSNKAAMLNYQIRLLSVMRWRAEWLRPNDRWYVTFRRYVELIAEKVRDLGYDPSKVPPTPDGNVPLPGRGEEGVPGKHDKQGCRGCLFRIFGL